MPASKYLGTNTKHAVQTCTQKTRAEHIYLQESCISPLLQLRFGNHRSIASIRFSGKREREREKRREAKKRIQVERERRRLPLQRTHQLGKCRSARCSLSFWALVSCLFSERLAVMTPARMALAGAKTGHTPPLSIMIHPFPTPLLFPAEIGGLLLLNPAFLPVRRLFASLFNDTIRLTYPSAL